jgi:hypothetical protein
LALVLYAVPSSAQSAADSARARAAAAEADDAARRRELDNRDNMRRALVTDMAAEGKKVGGPDVVTVPTIRGRVTDIRFFEGPPGPMPRGQRVFRTSFDAATARFIAVELEAHYPNPPIHSSVEFACVVRGPAIASAPGPVLGTARDSIAVDPGETYAYFSAGLGWREPGNWRPGKYVATCESRGVRIAEGTFAITAPGAAPAKPPAGTPGTPGAAPKPPAP